MTSHLEIKSCGCVGETGDTLASKCDHHTFMDRLDDQHKESMEMFQKTLTMANEVLEGTTRLVEDNKTYANALESLSLAFSQQIHLIQNAFNEGVVALEVVDLNDDYKGYKLSRVI
jgi:hypothetical protein